MKPEELEKKLEDLARPDFTNDMHKEQLKLTLLDARRTAWWGTLFVFVPALFLLAVFLKYGLGVGFIFDPLDKFVFAPLIRSEYKFIEPLLLFVIPLIALVLNILAITHFSRTDTEILISIKRRWWNLAIIAISAGVCGIIFLYALKGDK
jgi:hypothetical protein